MSLYPEIDNWLRIAAPILNRMMLLVTQINASGDPGLPGGDPDLPDAPLDTGIYFLLVIVLIYGMYKIKSQQSQSRI
jgi:hypothetical protein